MTQVYYKVGGVKYSTYQKAKKESEFSKLPLITCYERIEEPVYMTEKQKNKRIK